MGMLVAAPRYVTSQGVPIGQTPQGTPIVQVVVGGTVMPGRMQTSISMAATQPVNSTHVSMPARPVTPINAADEAAAAAATIHPAREDFAFVEQKLHQTDVL